MTIDHKALLARRFPEIEVQTVPRDAILYALGIGLGAEPTNEDQLKFVYEKNLVAFPTMPVVLGSPGMWFKDPSTGIDWTRVVHGAQEIRNHRPLRVGEKLVARNRVREIADKGEGKGAVLQMERVLQDEAGKTVATVVSTYVCRGNGGFGGPRGSAEPEWRLPDRPADAVETLPTLPQAALIYRLSGDMNPLHADPEFARKASFERPILHGLCTFAVAGHAILRRSCGYDPDRLRFLRGRFSAPVYPGETIETRMWNTEPGLVLFQSSVPARNVTVLTNGVAEIAV